MNKKRLLLFSVFALLHITTSERNFIDGGYGCCNHSSRYLSSDIGFSTNIPRRLQRLLPEIRQLNNPEKYPNSNVRDTETAQLSRRWQIGYIKQRSRDNDIVEANRRRQNRILTSPPEKILERQNFKERIYEHSNVLRNDFRRDRFAKLRDREYQRNIQTASLARSGNRKNIVTRNRFENRDVNRDDYNDHDLHTRNDLDNRNIIRRNLREHIERNVQSYRKGNNMRNDFDYVEYSESYLIPRKSILESIVRQETDLRNIRTVRNDRVIRLDNDRNIRLGTHRNLDEDLSQNESLRRSFVRNNVRSNENMDFKDDKRRSFSDNRNSRRFLVRDIDDLNSSIDNRKRFVRVHNRAVNIMSEGTRDYKIELRKTFELQRDYFDNTYKRTTRTQSDRRQDFDRYDVNRVKENRLSNRRSSSEEIYILRDDRNVARMRFVRRNVNYSVRYNRDTNEKEISKATYVNPNRNHENINFRQYKEMNKNVNTLESRFTNKDRYIESSDFSDITENRLSVRRCYDERALESYSKLITRPNLPIEKFRVTKIQRNINDAPDRMISRNREELSLSPKIRERGDSRQNSREGQNSRGVRSNENRVIVERRGQHRLDYRHEISNDRIRDNIQQRSENPFRASVRQDQNRITSRTHRNIVTMRRDIQITRANIENDFRRQSRSVSNERPLTSSRLDTRIGDQSRQTIQTPEERSINTQRKATAINDRRYSTTEFSDNKRSIMTHKIQLKDHIFEMKWQYLFYAMQVVYLCSILVTIPKDNEGNKHKKRIIDWFTPTEYLKVD